MSIKANSSLILALDQGTTSSRAIVYDGLGKEVSRGSCQLNVSFPHDAWVEQDAEEIWQSQKKAIKQALSSLGKQKISAVGITNQRETTIAWNPKTGEVYGPAIVWQCRRSAEICKKLRVQNIEKQSLIDYVSEKTGLVIDSYFSATKIAWMLENVEGLSEKKDNEEVVFGTVDSWLMYKLCKGALLSEPSNACRTMLYSIVDKKWDVSLLEFFGLSENHLMQVKPSIGLFAQARLPEFSAPVTAVLGDQQASLLGHGCLSDNEVKCTFGTGAFLLMNSGNSKPSSKNGLLSSVAWSFKDTTYALEGSIFIAGSLVQWLRDNLEIIETSEESEALARSVETSRGVVLVPAFVGLGAPYWREDIRGGIFGLTRDTKKAHIARAALEGVANQVADLLELEEFASVQTFSVDGGMVNNSLFCQILADICNVKIIRRKSTELTAFGVARAAAVGAGIYSSLEQACLEMSLSSEVEEFTPKLDKAKRNSIRHGWEKAIQSLIGPQ